MNEQLKALALTAVEWRKKDLACYDSQCTCKADEAAFVNAASPEVVLGLIEQIARLTAALAQPAQAPVAWGMPHRSGLIFDVICPDEHARCEGEYTVPLYLHPKEAK